MKRDKLMILTLVLILMGGSLISCKRMLGEASPAPEPSSPSPTGEATGQISVVVDIFQYKPDYKEAFEKASKGFMEKNENVSINVETIENGQDYTDALRKKFSSGQEPAIFNINGPKDIKEWKDKLLDLSSTEVAKNVMEGLVNDVTVDGQILGLPINIEGYGLVYNKKLFEKAQVDPNGIDSFEALEEAVKELDKQKKDLGIDAVFGFPAKEIEIAGLYISNIYLSPEFEGDAHKTLEAKTIEFKYANELQSMIDLQNNYSVQPSWTIDFKTQVEQLFSKEKVAMIHQGNWAYAAIEEANKELAQNNIGILPYHINGVKEDAIPAGVPMFWAFNKSKPQDVQEAAKDFINWLYLTEEGKDVITEKFKFIPAYKGFSADAIADPLGKDLIGRLSTGNTIDWVFSSYPENWGTELGKDIQLYVQNKISWEQVIKNAKANWEKARK